MSNSSSLYGWKDTDPRMPVPGLPRVIVDRAKLLEMACYCNYQKQGGAKPELDPVEVAKRFETYITGV